MACALHWNAIENGAEMSARGRGCRSGREPGPEEDTVKTKPHSPAARTAVRSATEVYCRRDNRVYAVCPHVAQGSRCRCLSEVETADALFESDEVGAGFGR